MNIYNSVAASTQTNVKHEQRTASWRKVKSPCTGDGQQTNASCVPDAARLQLISQHDKGGQLDGRLAWCGAAPSMIHRVSVPKRRGLGRREGRTKERECTRARHTALRNKILAKGSSDRKPLISAEPTEKGPWKC